MACPFFQPAEPFSWQAWPDPPRMPLGDPYSGSCSREAADVPETRLRTCCNTGYARGTCPNFPGAEAPDAVRFGILERHQGLVKIRYVVERDHYPHSHGILELQETAGSIGSREIVESQARAYLNSYLRRNSKGETEWSPSENR